MSEEIAKLIKELHQAGQTGLIVLFVILAVLLIAGVWMYILQRRTINMLVEAQSVIDAKIKAADSLREESRKSQEMSSSDLSGRIDGLATINDDLRKEVERLSGQQQAMRQSQNDFKQSVKESIKIGLQEIKSQLADVKLTELLDEVPESFRNDLQQQITETSRAVIEDVIHRLKESPTELIEISEINRDLRHAIDRVIRDNVPMPPQYWDRDYLDRDEWRHCWGRYHEDYANFLAERIAHHLRRHY